MKRLKLELRYTDATKCTSHFDIIVELPLKLPLFVGDEITMGEYGTPTKDEFFESKNHKDEYCDEYDHDQFEVVGITKLNYLETNFGNIYFKNCMVDEDGTNLEEGCTLWNEDGDLIGDFVGLDINDEILDKNNLPDMYTKEDYRMQLERIENILKYS